MTTDCFVQRGWTEGRPGKGRKALRVRIDGISRGSLRCRVPQGRDCGVNYLSFGRVMDELPYGKVGSTPYRGHYETELAASVTELHHFRGCS